jgi:hypothetical protein
MKYLNEAQATELHSLVVKAMAELKAPIAANSDLVADLYTGRNPSGSSLILPDGGVALQNMGNLPSQHDAPDTTANLFLSRLRQIVISTTPGHPSFEISALVPGATYQVEAQQRLTDVILKQTNIDKVFERAAFLGPTQNYFGIKLIPDPDADHILDRLSFEAIESSQCGYEPFARRFTWHSYQMQYGKLPQEWQPPAQKGDPDMKPWDMVSVTEVYHTDLELGPTPSKYKLPMSIFVNLKGELWQRRRKTPSLGTYVATADLPAPVLVIDQYLDAAPNEDIAPAEVVSWIPLMRQIVAVLVQITESIETTNNEVLYDKEAINPETMQLVRDAARGAKIYIPVNVNDVERGVNSTMRPVERNSVIPDYLRALSTFISLFDDVTGVSPMERGAATNPEKSATEAARLSAAGDRRNQDRMRVLARMWGKIAELTFRWQGLLYGASMEVVTAPGMTKNIPVPDAETARFAFGVNVAEMQNKSRALQLETLMTAHTLLVNDATNLQDPNALRMVAESRRRLLNGLGWIDVELYSPEVFGETGPMERYTRLLETGQPMPVYADDKHDAYIPAYMKLVERAQATANPDIPVAALMLAIQEHATHMQKQQEALAAQAGSQPATVPGVGPGGGIDNQVAADVGAGQAPQQTPQTVA